MREGWHGGCSAECMLCLPRCLGASIVLVFVLLGERAGAQSAGRAGETRSLPAEQARTRDVARAEERPRPVTAGRVVIESAGAMTGAFAAAVVGIGFIALTGPSCDSEGERDFCGMDAL